MHPRLTLVALLALAAYPAAAQSSLKVRNGPPTPLVTNSGFYFGPNVGRLTADPTQPEVDLFLVNVLNRVDWGQTWSDNLPSLVSGAPQLLQGTSNTILYKKTVYLATMYHLVGTPWSNWWGIQSALWNWPYGGSGGNGNGGTGANGNGGNQTGGNGNGGNGNGGNSSAGSGGYGNGGNGGNGGDGGHGVELGPQVEPQDPMTSGVTPEPGTWVLMGTGLVVALFAVRRGSLL